MVEGVDEFWYGFTEGVDDVFGFARGLAIYVVDDDTNGEVGVHDSDVVNGFHEYCLEEGVSLLVSGRDANMCYDGVGYSVIDNDPSLEFVCGESNA